MELYFKKELNDILEQFGGQLDISKTEYETAIRSYNEVGQWLSKEDSPLFKYKPEISPQGSFMLGTMIKPINKEDDLDIDLVCRLDNIPRTWSQKDLKNAIGDRIKDHGRYFDMLKTKEGGKRCWTLVYAESSNYHMDILPSISSTSTYITLESRFSNYSSLDIEKSAIRITDNESGLFDVNVEHSWWDKSNPFGFAGWFFRKALIDSTVTLSLKEAIDPVRDFETSKLPLQRVVQLMKRHRDIMFLDNSLDTDDKPISIIITTLAGLAYDKSDNIFDSLKNIVNNMTNTDFIEEKWDDKINKYVKVIKNPVNKVENFADKWCLENNKEKYFYLWYNKLKSDVDNLMISQNRGHLELSSNFSKQFGEDLTSKVFENISKKTKSLRDDGKLKMSVGTGLLGSTGTKVKKHGFYGNK